MVAASPSFVGRERELAELEAALDEVWQGSGRLLVISGEPGIGKSRLVEELVMSARRRGAVVAWGRCWEAGGAPAYWPFVQALQTCLREPAAAAVLSDPSVSSILGQIVPDLRREGPADGSPFEGDAARFQLFEAVVRILKAAAAEAPLILILEDMHAADTASLLLLRFVARSLEGGRIAVVATHRDLELHDDHPLAQLVEELGRERTAQHLRLGGLASVEVATLIDGMIGRSVTPSTTRAIHRETAGNPLFVGELVRLLEQEGRLGDVTDTAGARRILPRGVKEAVERRLEGLPTPSRDALGICSVLGRDFDVRIAAEVSGRPVADLLDELEPARGAGVVAAVLGDPNRWRFAHSLVQEVLYDELPRGRRSSLHGRAGEILERSHASDLDHHLAELAFHAFQAMPSGDPARAVAYGTRAGERAVRSLAYEEGARLFAMALTALEHVSGEDHRARCDLFLKLGDARARGGEVETAKEAFLRAGDIAAGARDPERLARAALGYGGRFVWEVGRGDPHLATLLRRALRELPEEDTELRARLLARLAAGPLRDDPDRSPREEMSRHAVDIARRLGDDRTLAYCLDGRYAAVWWPENLEERIAVATELATTAEAAGDRERAFQGYHYRCLANLERVNLAGVRADLSAQERLARELGQPVHLWYVAMVRTMLAVMEGRLADAEAQLPETLELGLQAHGSIMLGYRALQMYTLHREQGRLAAHERDLSRAATTFPSYVVLRCAKTQLLAELAREQEAREALDELAFDGFAVVPRNDEWLFGMCLLAEAVFQIRDDARAPELYDMLLPFAGRLAVSPINGCVGAVARHLGLLAAMCGRSEEAEEHFVRAHELNERVGARPWVIRSMCDRAETYLQFGASQDAERAVPLLHAALEEASAMGLTGLRDRAALALAGSESTLPSVERTFMFTDIVGSSALIEAIGDDAWRLLRRWHDTTLRRAFGLHAGEEIDHAGDGFFVAFAVAPDAVACAVAIQRTLEEHRRKSGFAPQVRIGVHTAETTRSGDGYAGRGVHEAARIAAIAGPGEVLASQRTVQGLTGVEVSEPREFRLKGFRDPSALVSIGWRPGASPAAQPHA